MKSAINTILKYAQLLASFVPSGCISKSSAELLGAVGGVGCFANVNSQGVYKKFAKNGASQIEVYD